MAGSSKKAIYAALAGNSLIAITKFTAAGISGSPAMSSEGIHSLVDTGNQVLLLHGMRRADKPADKHFPFGHGKDASLFVVVFEDSAALIGLCIACFGLLIGESAAPEVVETIRDLLNAETRIAHVNEVATLHMGPDHVSVMLSVDFHDGLDSSEVESATTTLNKLVKQVDVSIRRVFIEAERASDHKAVPR